MSSNEYAKVKGSISWLLHTASKQVAREMDMCIYEKTRNCDNPIMRNFYELEVERIFTQFTSAIETLYPNNSRKVEDMVQYVDELIAEFENNRKHANDHR